MSTFYHLETNPQRPSAWSSSQEQCDEARLRKDLSPSEQSLTQPSSPSPAPVFSPNSSPSSQSSVSDTGVTAWSGSNPTFSGEVQSQTFAPASLGTQTRVHGHPRRTQAPPTWIRPSLVRQDQRRQQLVEQLVDAATQLVALVWPESNSTKAFQNRVISLRFFIRETLRRSRTSYSTLQVTLWYLILIRPHVTQSFSEIDSHQQGGVDCPSDPCRPLQCGRRMFLSALILASKFLQDRNFTARAWSKITGLPISDIISNEFLFLTKISWNLHMKEQDFACWNCIITRCTESTQLGRNVRDTWKTVLECMVDNNLSPRETAEVLSAQHRHPVSFKDAKPSSLESMCASEPTCMDASLATFDFPNQASPFSSAGSMGTSSSPLVAMDEVRAGGPAIDASGHLATPSSMSSSLLEGSPSRLDTDNAVASADLVPRTSSSANRQRRFVANRGVLTPMSSASPPASVGATRASCQSRCLVQPSSLNEVNDQRQNRPQPCRLNVSSDAWTPRSSTANGASRNVQPGSALAWSSDETKKSKLNAVDLYAAITQEYRRQKQQRSLLENCQSGQKRSLCDAIDPRSSKLRCRDDVDNAPCLMTPIASQATDE